MAFALAASLGPRLASAQAAVHLQSISVSPNRFVGAAQATGTVKLSGKATQDFVVGLSAELDGITLPTQVTVKKGATSATFPFAVPMVTAETGTKLFASAGGTTVQCSLSLVPLAFKSFTLKLGTTPIPVCCGSGKLTGTIQLAQAVTSKLTLELASDNENVSVPASVTIPAGGTTATFTANVKAVTQNATATIYCPEASSTFQAKVDLVPVALDMVYFIHSIFVGSGPLTVELILTAPPLSTQTAQLSCVNKNVRIDTTRPYQFAIGQTIIPGRGTVTSPLINPEAATLQAKVGASTKALSLTLVPGGLMTDGTPKQYFDAGNTLHAQRGPGDNAIRWIYQASTLPKSEVVVDRNQNVYFVSDKIVSLDAYGHERWTVSSAHGFPSTFFETPAIDKIWTLYFNNNSTYWAVTTSGVPLSNTTLDLSVVHSSASVMNDGAYFGYSANSYVDSSGVSRSRSFYASYSVLWTEWFRSLGIRLPGVEGWDIFNSIDMAYQSVYDYTPQINAVDCPATWGNRVYTKVKGGISFAIMPMFNENYFPDWPLNEPNPPTAFSPVIPSLIRPIVDPNDGALITLDAPISTKNMYSVKRYDPDGKLLSACDVPWIRVKNHPIQWSVFGDVAFDPTGKSWEDRKLYFNWGDSSIGMACITLGGGSASVGVAGDKTTSAVFGPPALGGSDWYAWASDGWLYKDGGRFLRLQDNTQPVQWSNRPVFGPDGTMYVFAFNKLYCIGSKK